MIQSASIIVHSSYRPNTNNYDFALLRLSRRISLDGKTKAVIRLPASNDVTPDGASALTSGWGQTLRQSESDDELRAVVVAVQNQNKCNNDYRGFITPQMICAGSPGKDSCFVSFGDYLV